MELKTFTASKKINGTERDVELIPTRYMDMGRPDDDGLSLIIHGVSVDEAVSMLGAIADDFIIVKNAAAQVAVAAGAKAEIRQELKDPDKGTKAKKKKAAAKDEKTEAKTEAEPEKKPAAKKKKASTTKKKAETTKKKAETKAAIEVEDKTEEAIDEDGFPADTNGSNGNGASATSSSAASSGDVPEEVKTQTTARGLLTMLSSNFENREDLVSHCVSIQDQVPLLSRMGGNVANRIERALDILKLFPEDNG